MSSKSCTPCNTCIAHEAQRLVSLNSSVLCITTLRRQMPRKKEATCAIVIPALHRLPGLIISRQILPSGNLCIAKQCSVLTRHFPSDDSDQATTALCTQGTDTRTHKHIHTKARHTTHTHTHTHTHSTTHHRDTHTVQCIM